jgi:hypothetical protein
MNHEYPDWALAFRKPGTELRFINNTYYLYEVTAFYDPVKKKGRKMATKSRIISKNSFLIITDS